MLKIIPPHSYPFGEQQLQAVKLASGGLRGSDLAEFIKRADHCFLDALRDCELHPGEVPVHIIALGATERIGPNRNGDGFSDKTCRTYHDTFVKHGRIYRNHRNKDRSKSYGRIIKSAYNERMGRVELLAALNGTPEAAERNGGLLADQELEKLASNDDSPTSMAGRVPYDVCSCCQHQAKTRDEYCDEDTCAYGGLRHNITKVAEDGNVLYADNPHVCWFDLSSVCRGADRISFLLGQALEKAASAQSACGGAWLAEQLQLTTPEYVLLSGVGDAPDSAALLKLACQLAAVERTQPHGNAAFAFTEAVRPPITEWPDVRTGRCKLADAFGALAASQVLLTPHGFLTLLLGEKQAAEAAFAVAARLPGLFGRCLEDEAWLARLADNPYTASAQRPPLGLQLWGEKLAADYGLGADDVCLRIYAATLRGAQRPAPRTAAVTLTKTAADDGADELAKHYAAYQLAFLTAAGRGCSHEISRLASLLAQHNSVV